MAITFTHLDSGEYVCSGGPYDVLGLASGYCAALISNGVSEDEADLVSIFATYDTAWYSGIYGFAHDCSQHSVEEALEHCDTIFQVYLARN